MLIDSASHLSLKRFSDEPKPLEFARVARTRVNVPASYVAEYVHHTRVNVIRRSFTLSRRHHLCLCTLRVAVEIRVQALQRLRHAVRGSRPGFSVRRVAITLHIVTIVITEPVHLFR